MLGMSLSAGHGLSGPLYRVDQVPEDYHEHYIIRGYRRPKSSFTQCLLSLFDPTNETLNFWTHFLPFCYFVWLIIQFNPVMNFLHDPYSWPLLCYLLTCCAFTLASAIAHLFNIMSENVRHSCFFLDYSAISLYTCGSAIVYRAYCFPTSILSLDDDSWLSLLRDNYVLISIFNSFFCTAMTCHTRFMKPSPLRKVLRLGSFALPYLCQMIPIIVRLVENRPSPTSPSSPSIAGVIQETHPLSADYYHKIQFFFAFLSAFVYASHLPERIMPGIFDIVGHSHQLFHIATVLAVCVQLQSITFDVHERKDFLLAYHWIFGSSSKSLGVIFFVFIANILIVLYFVYKLYNPTTAQSDKKSK